MKMNIKKIISIFCVTTLLLSNVLILPGTLSTKTPCTQTTTQITCTKNEETIPNLGMVKKQLDAYFTSGTYEKEVACVASNIKRYLSSFNPLRNNYALVFDIDDTLLSTWAYSKENDYGYNKERFFQWELSAQLPAIKPMRDLYHFAQQKGFSIFFITGRKLPLKEATIKNLHQQGFDDWKDIFFKPHATVPSRTPFKSHARKTIEEQGYTIIANIGDQLSDLEGGYALKTFKLPNPMYYIP